MGRPCVVNPHGTEIAGNPQTLIGRVLRRRSNLGRAQQRRVFHQIGDSWGGDRRCGRDEDVNLLEFSCDVAARLLKISQSALVFALADVLSGADSAQGFWVDRARATTRPSRDGRHRLRRLAECGPHPRGNSVRELLPLKFRFRRPLFPRRRRLLGRGRQRSTFAELRSRNSLFQLLWSLREVGRRISDGVEHDGGIFHGAREWGRRGRAKPKAE